MCNVQQRLVDKCRPKVYRGSPLTAQRPGCTSVWHKCLTSGDKCANAYRLAVRNCVGVIEGGNQLGKSLQCPLNCVGAMAGLYDKAPGFYRCRPDGMRRDWWTRWNRNMTGSCKLKCAFKSQGRYDALTKCWVPPREFCGCFEVKTCSWNNFVPRKKGVHWRSEQGSGNKCTVAPVLFS